MVHAQAVRGLSFARSVVSAFHCQAVPGTVASTVDRAQLTTDSSTTPGVCVSSSHLRVSHDQLPPTAVALSP